MVVEYRNSEICLKKGGAYYWWGCFINGVRFSIGRGTASHHSSL